MRLSQEQINVDLFDEVKRLQVELKESQRINSVMDDDSVKAGRKIMEKENGRAELQWQIDRTVEALEFYADEKSYSQGMFRPAVLLDGGRIARKALEQSK